MQDDWNHLDGQEPALLRNAEARRARPSRAIEKAPFPRLEGHPCRPPNLASPELCLPGEDEVHLWYATSKRAESLPDLERLLSGDELARADRFLFDQHRRHYVTARGLLRSLLSRYLGIPPADIRFRYGPHGKPVLDPAMNADGVMFNLSKSDGHTLCAVTRGYAVGVDIERVRQFSELEGIVRRCFSPAEQAEFTALDSEERLLAFFNVWTRKEAVLKAIGCGIWDVPENHNLQRQDEPGQHPRLVGPGSDMTTVDGWHVRHVEPEPGFIGAVAVQRPPASLSLRVWRNVEPSCRRGRVHPSMNAQVCRR